MSFLGMTVLLFRGFVLTVDVGEGGTNFLANGYGPNEPLSLPVSPGAEEIMDLTSAAAATT